MVTEHDDLAAPSQFQPLSQQEYWNLRKTYPLRDPLPWYLDNGPLTPGGFGMEFRHAFDPIPDDPIGTDIYVTKAQKYGAAPDAYVAFPIVYFHYGPDGPPTRRVLADPERKRGWDRLRRSWRSVGMVSLGNDIHEMPMLESAAMRDATW